MEAGNRYIVLNTIKSMPGIRYMELKRLTGLSYGTLTYHLAMLEREGSIRVMRTSRKSRYYPSGVDDLEADVIDCIRSRTCKDVLAVILEHGIATLDMLSKLLNKAKTTVKYHVDRLKYKGIVEGKRIGRYIFYRVKSDTILSKIRASLLVSTSR
ncbi:MAG: hypothetical protein RMJ59_05635 [Candidatus Nitrosocaldus sp.]|nr:hypothetical protein [Candidatus Nitrosocaldus sp.]MCS7142043.1 hypothetical protein [Candidatus Nitrosocaldus sp.]MDW8000941.1 hypothetical protein [Candidatus Nitrosocaldus sp.]MDW8275844.1 hypothetical protein [Candidatus Nitrosocaldus sp.]